MFRIGICENQWGLSHLNASVNVSMQDPTGPTLRMDDALFFSCKKDVSLTMHVIKCRYEFNSYHEKVLTKMSSPENYVYLVILVKSAREHD
jgi:hypothetical protein